MPRQAAAVLAQRETLSMLLKSSSIIGVLLWSPFTGGAFVLWRPYQTFVSEPKIAMKYSRKSKDPRSSCNESHLPLFSETSSNKARYMALDGENDGSTGNCEEETPVGEAILQLALPALGALLIDPLMTLIDTIFVGRYAETADDLAGMGTAAALLTSSFFVFNFLCTATTPLVASRRASGSESDALSVGGQALTLALLLGVFVAGGLLLLTQPLLQLMGTGITGVDASRYATEFLTVRALAAPAIFIGSASSGILRGYLDTKTPLVILVVANTINVVMDGVLIAGARLGPMGAAIATTTSEWVAALLYLGVLAGKLPSADGELGSNQESNRSDDFLSVVPTISIPKWKEIRPLLVASSSVFLRSAVLQLSLSSAAAMAARGGSSMAGVDAAQSVAAHQIAIQLWLLCSFVCDALAAASQGLVADGIGRNDSERVRNITKTVFSYSLVQGVILAAALQLGSYSHFLLDAFTNDAGTRTALSRLLPVLILSQPLSSFVFAADGVLQGASEFAYQAKAMAISAISAFACFAYLQHTNAESETLVHVWLALTILQLMRGVTSVVKIIDGEGPIDLLDLQ